MRLGSGAVGYRQNSAGAADFTFRTATVGSSTAVGSAAATPGISSAPAPHMSSAATPSMSSAAAPGMSSAAAPGMSSAATHMQGFAAAAAMADAIRGLGTEAERRDSDRTSALTLIAM